MSPFPFLQLLRHDMSNVLHIGALFGPPLRHSAYADSELQVKGDLRSESGVIGRRKRIDGDCALNVRRTVTRLVAAERIVSVVVIM